MTTATKIDKQGKQYIADLAATVRQIWNQACDYDGILRDSRFVCFSGDNPFLKFHVQSLNQYFEAVKAYRAGGYIGLRIKNGRVSL